MLTYVCALCGYEYETETGVPECGIEEGTEFEDLPDDFTCPLCGASKTEFEPVEREEE